LGKGIGGEGKPWLSVNGSQAKNRHGGEMRATKLFFNQPASFVRMRKTPEFPACGGPPVAHIGFPEVPGRPDPCRGDPAAGMWGSDPALSAKEPPRGALQRYSSIRDGPPAAHGSPDRYFRPLGDPEAGLSLDGGGMRNMIVDRGKPDPRPRVLLADDHDFMRAGLRFVLEAKSDLEVVGEASDGEEAVAMCRGLRPDLVLMDITMPRMNGIQATRAIKAEMPEVAVLVLTSHVAEDVLMEAIRAGAAGYVLKGSRREDVVGAVRAVLSGETPLDQNLAMRLLRRVARSNGQPAAAAPSGVFHPGANPLTPRETEVLRLLATGKTNRQLAAELHISLSTVKRHVERIIVKLKVSDRTQAAVRAGELGLLPPARTGG